MDAGIQTDLTGDDIPLISRIIAVADAYNAMTSDRPYRDAMPSRVARLRLAQAVESQFDTGQLWQHSKRSLLAGTRRIGSEKRRTLTSSRRTKKSYATCEL